MKTVQFSNNVLEPRTRTDSASRNPRTRTDSASRTPRTRTDSASRNPRTRTDSASRHPGADRICSKRGSIFQLFQDTGEDPRKLSLAASLSDVLGSKKKEKRLVKQFSRQESDYLREQVLYKGAYRIINVAVILIILLVIFCIIFLSAWHFTDNTYWVLYLVLGIVVALIMAVLLYVKGYYYYKRYYDTPTSAAIVANRSEVFQNPVFDQTASDDVIEHVGNYGDVTDRTCNTSGDVTDRTYNTSDDIVPVVENI